ncbi:MAG TPA: phosphatidate cytidylyltransferase [Thermoleophilaceae bacterium]|nr:phosphatidate cytidylyltransferase [Thermoleophilaceae bacterium]
MGETGRRVLYAIPAIVFAASIIVAGGLVFTAGVILVGVICLRELYEMLRQARPVDIAGYLALAALCLTALYGEREQLVLVLVLSLPVTFLLTVARPFRARSSWGMAATMLGIVWIGLALAHAVLLREIPHGGALVLDVCVGTFIGDTAAYFGGRAWGRTRIAPRISPNKTLAGLVSGVVGGTFAFWLFGLAYQHEWFHGTDRLLIGLSVALVAPIGDLFESLIKRDLGVKDTGRLFGAHGGALDRLDAVLFSVVAAYYVSVAVL